MVKSPTFEPKKAIGIGLRPALWRRIDAYAEAQGKSSNLVIEQILDAQIPAVADLRKTQEDSRKTEIAWGRLADE